MYRMEQISIDRLLFDIHNYRIVKQSNQKDTLNAIIAEQGKKLIKLAEDIAKNGLNPSDIPIVINANDGSQNYIVVEGNRRLSAINLTLNPELAKDTALLNAFIRLNKHYANKMPKQISCVIVPSRQSALIWINRKHSNGLKGAGTERWSALAKARAEAERGIPRPDLAIKPSS